jgi:hypothetical protein
VAALKDRLARIEDRLRARPGTLGSTPAVRREPTSDELIETALTLLTYVHEGDTEAFAQSLVKDHGSDSESAKECAEILGVLLEERRAVAEDPSRPI